MGSTLRHVPRHFILVWICNVHLVELGTNGSKETAWGWVTVAGAIAEAMGGLMPGAPGAGSGASAGVGAGKVPATQSSTRG